jgi:hypothetical protein
MINDNSDDEFLDTLYKQSALEKPPADVDKQILALAKTNHQRNRFAMTMNLQRVLSVAAVMVLSVYIFFEVGGDRPTRMDEEFLYPDKSILRSSPSATQPENVDMSGKDQAIKQFKNKEAKKSAERAMVEYENNAIGELAAEAQEQSESDMSGLSDVVSSEPSVELSATPSSAPSSAPVLMRQKLKAEQALEPANAEAMLKEIEQLLASGKLEQAKLVYGQFKLLFPEHPVPVFISDFIDKHKN